MSTALRLFVVSVLALLLASVTRPAQALAQGDPRVEIRANLAFAEENFDLGEPKAARDALVGALARLTSAQLGEDPLAARVHLFLAVLYLGPLDDADKGRRHMQRALAIDPEVEIDSERAGDAARSAFAELKRAAEIAGGAVDCTALRGILHTPVSEADIGQPVAMRVHVGKLLTESSVHVRYRTSGSSSWSEIDMAPGEECERIAELPAASAAQTVEYWIVARTAAGKTAAQDGSEGAPHRLGVAGAVQSTSPQSSTGQTGSDETEVPPAIGARPEPRGSTCAGCSGSGTSPLAGAGLVAIVLGAAGRRRRNIQRL